MQDILKPLRAESLKEVFISRFENLILTGRLAIGQKLPPERELALQLGVSRPVVHEGLVELAARGLVKLKPRVGTVVNDYRKEGSLAILESLINFQQDSLNPELLESLIRVRALVETETARLAAANRTDEHIETFREIASAEEAAGPRNIEKITRLDFEFHLAIGVASGNLVYPLLINSFRPVYMNFTSLFFTDPEVIPETLSFHRRLLTAIEERNSNQAVAAMIEMLAHGEQRLRKLLRPQ
jgi:fatty acid metabolism transcriptional regulator FadR